MRRALFVSHYFPPRYSVGGKRAQRFARYLPEHGYRVTVLTTAAPVGERIDPSLDDADLAGADVHRDLFGERSRVARRPLGSDGTVDAPTTAWGTPAKRSLRFADIAAALRPSVVLGPEAGELPRLFARILALVEETTPQVIFASGGPFEPVIAAVLAARVRRIPVVVDLRDPWSFGPVASRKSMPAQRALSLLERLVLHGAAAVTVTTEATRARYAEMGIARRLARIPTGWDPSVQVMPRRDDKRATFIHFGNCYGERDLGAFLRAMASLVRGGRIAPSALRILNLGRVASADLELARDLGVATCFEHRTVVPYSEGIDLVAGADLALLAGFGEEPWFIPGKLYDYLLARAPILATSASPELAAILASTGAGWSERHDDVDALARRMEQALAMRHTRVTPTPEHEARIQSLSARATSAELARLFDEVTREPRS